MKEFRNKHPHRTCTKKYQNYQNYKSFLAQDFFGRCGYTNCSDFWFGGSNNFHIDHFRPWKQYPKNPELKTDYQNLVYCCSYVNILKSNDETNYLDPCNVNFNEHFYRDDLGNIIPNDASQAAKYMYGKLKLYMKRYQIIWMLDTIIEKMEQVKVLLESADDIHKGKLREAMCELSCLFLDYKKYLSNSQ